MHQQLFNRPEYTQRRQELRKNQTATEQILWQALRGKQLGVKFRRQHGIGYYIADFYCAECHVVIEIDGNSHFSPQAQANDKIRDDFLQNSGIKVIRFTNQDISHNLANVLNRIKEICFVPTPDKGQN
jgi:very-short-patch-repair endonuclease